MKPSSQKPRSMPKPFAVPKPSGIPASGDQVMTQLRKILGKEMALDDYHGTIRRAASQIPGITAYGSCLATCSDELQGEMRHSFEREISNPLISGEIPTHQRVFSVSNLGGRIEPGAIGLVEQHFSTKAADRGTKLILVAIGSHVGRMKKSATIEHGVVDRFGQESPCCGALRLLLDGPVGSEVVRHPWREQLDAFFGPVRLASLRKQDSSTQMIATSVIHAVLQAESALADFLRHPPQARTHLLLVASVAINQEWTDGALPVAYHHLRAENGAAEILDGFSLRSTPESLDIDASGPHIKIDIGEEMESSGRIERTEFEPDPVAQKKITVADEHRAAADARIARAREQITTAKRDPVTWRVYARPILRGLFQGLSLVAPEVAIATMLAEGGKGVVEARKLERVLQAGPGSRDGRRALHDIEAELQQLNHEDAQQVLEILIAEKETGQI